jgi:glycosyltransferase involved in cell wall biosynthesis
MLPGRVVYYLSDYWPSAQNMHTTYWQKPARKSLMRFPKRVLSALAQAKLTRTGCPELRFEHVICVSKAVRDNLIAAGVPVENARIIHGGTDVARFSTAAGHSRTYDQLRLLYAGQLVSHKGVHTAIEAMALLSNSQPPDRIRLTLIGSGHPQYETFLRDLVIRKDLQEYVFFRGALNRDEMPDALQQFDVLIFPSIYEEPLARMTQEAMVAGLVVVGTTTGGTNEILVEGENGLTFAAEDAACLAKQIARLAADSELCRRLAEAGRQTVLAKFTLERMITEIEEYLRNVAYDAYPVSHQLLPTL